MTWRPNYNLTALKLPVKLQSANPIDKRNHIVYRKHLDSFVGYRKNLIIVSLTSYLLPEIRRHDWCWFLSWDHFSQCLLWRPCGVLIHDDGFSHQSKLALLANVWGAAILGKKLLCFPPDLTDHICIILFMICDEWSMTLVLWFLT